MEIAQGDHVVFGVKIRQFTDGARVVLKPKAELGPLAQACAQSGVKGGLLVVVAAAVRAVAVGQGNSVIQMQDAGDEVFRTQNHSLLSPRAEPRDFIPASREDTDGGDRAVHKIKFASGDHPFVICRHEKLSEPDVEKVGGVPMEVSVSKCRTDLRNRVVEFVGVARDGIGDQDP